MHRATALALTLGVLVVVAGLAACSPAPGGSGSPESSPAASAIASPDAASSAEPTTSSGASVEPTASSPAPSPSSAASSGGTATGSDCSAVGSDLMAYPDLLATIPDELGGQATHSRQSFRIVDYLCVAAGQDVVDTAIAAAPDGFDLTAVQYATAAVNLGDVTSTVAAVRVPGQDAGRLADDFERIAPLFAGATEPIAADRSEDTVGGKSVVILQPEEARPSYLYTNGDVLYVVAPRDPEAAETILAALP